MTQAFFTWTDEFTLGYPPIDAQHKQVLDLLNVLDSIDVGSDNGVLASRVLFPLVVFTETHFAYEESLLDLLGFDNMKRHRRYHHIMKLNTREIVDKYRKKRVFDKSQVLLFVRDWWTNHILQEDKKYQPLLIQHGLAQPDS